MKTNEIKLTPEQRKEKEDFSTKGVRSVSLVNRTKIILLLDTSVNGEAVKQEEITHMVGVSRVTVNRVRSDFQAAESVSEFLQRKKRETPPIEPKITGDVEARIIALACGNQPEGCARWTLRLLAVKSVELGIIDSISYSSVGSLLKKHNLSLT
jgi:predicted XRE-type DNA-binding protein